MTAIAITGLHRGDNPQPGAAVATSLRRRFPDLRIVGLSYDPLESALYCRDDSRLDAAYLLPYPGTGPVALLDRLDEILERETIDVIIPCLDTEVANFISIEAKLAERGIQCTLPTQQAFDDRGKVHLSEFCYRSGIPTPRTKIAGNMQSLALYAEEIGYPLYVKGRFYEALRVTTLQELYAAYDHIVSVWGGPALVQEMLIGEEYNIAGLGNGRGGLVGSSSLRKMLPNATGKGFAGVVVSDPDLDRVVERTIKALRWKGPFELEFIKVPGLPHMLFEMNPRFPAWIDFPAQIDCNLPARLLEDLLQLKSTPLRTCSPGQMFIRHAVDLVADIADVAHMITTGERAEETAPSKPEVKATR